MVEVVLVVELAESCGKLVGFDKGRTGVEEGGRGRREEGIQQACRSVLPSLCFSSSLTGPVREKRVPPQVFVC